jgi:hypothetical protein
MIRVVPDYYYSEDGHILVNPAQVTHVDEVYSNEKELKKHICLRLHLSCGTKVVAKNLRQEDWEKVYYSKHYGIYGFPFDYIKVNDRKPAEDTVDERLKPL